VFKGKISYKTRTPARGIYTFRITTVQEKMPHENGGSNCFVQTTTHQDIVIITLAYRMEILIADSNCKFKKYISNRRLPSSVIWRLVL
jgi:hypothetical protein